MSMLFPDPRFVYPLGLSCGLPRSPYDGWLQTDRPAWPVLLVAP